MRIDADELGVRRVAFIPLAQGNEQPDIVLPSGAAETPEGGARIFPHEPAVIAAADVLQPSRCQRKVCKSRRRTITGPI